jgi:peptidoglycan/LPS O-acetylase OafA/YrhL
LNDTNTLDSYETAPKYTKLRWAAMLPVAVLGALIGPALVYVWNWLGSSGDPSRIEQFFLLVAQSAAMGAAFVWAATYVAPRHKEKVAMVFAGLAVFIFGGMAVLFLTTQQWTNLGHIVISAVAAGITGYVLHREHV